MIYHAIGKAVVKYGAWYVWRRYRRPLTIGGGLAVVAFGAALYWAAREVPEG